LPYTPIHIVISILLTVLLRSSSTLVIDFWSGLSLVLGSTLMDMDQLLAFFVYEEEPYSTCRGFLVRRELRKLLKYIEKNHKRIDKLFLHNYLSFFLVTLTSSLTIKMASVSALFLFGMFIHMILDLFDDLYVINSYSNWLWFLRRFTSFDKSSKVTLFMTLVNILSIAVLMMALIS